MINILSKVLSTFTAILLIGATGSISHACKQEGKIKSISNAKNNHLITLDNGFVLNFDRYGIYPPLIDRAAESGNEVCISNLGYDQEDSNLGYPTQVVVNLDLSKQSKTPLDQNCVKNGKINRIIVNMNYVWVYLEDGFNIRLKHWSKMVPQLYDAAFANKEVCVLQMNLNSSGPDWGIPRKIIMKGN